MTKHCACAEVSGPDSRLKPECCIHFAILGISKRYRSECTQLYTCFCHQQPISTNQVRSGQVSSISILKDENQLNIQLTQKWLKTETNRPKRKFQVLAHQKQLKVETETERKSQVFQLIIKLKLREKVRFQLIRSV